MPKKTLSDYPTITGMENAYREAQEDIDGALQTEDALANAVDLLINRCERIAVDTETSSLSVFTEIAGVSLAGRDRETNEIYSWYVPIDHRTWDRQVTIEIAREHLDKPFKRLPLVMHSAGFDTNVLTNHGFYTPPSREIDDTFLISFLLNENGGHGLKYLARQLLGMDMVDYENLPGAKGNKDARYISVAQITSYARDDAVATLRLYERLMPALMSDEPLYKWYKIEQRMVDLVRKMRLRGVRVDPELIRTLRNAAYKKLASIERDIYKALGKSINLNSPERLAEALYDIGVFYSRYLPTYEGILRDLADEGADVCRLILEYRRTFKDISTFYEPIPNYIEVDGRVHPDLKPLMTETGRFTCQKPNLQQARRPEADSDGKTKVGIRHAMIPTPGFVLIAADLSQAEVRVMAHLSGDENLQRICSEADMHKHSAALMSGKKLSAVTKTERQHAKGTTFGELYKQSWRGLQRYLKKIGIKLTDEEAQQAHSEWHRAFPGVAIYHNKMEREVTQRGYVTTLFGRKRRPEGLSSSDGRTRGHAIREAINFPVQGLVADIVKLCMLKLEKLEEIGCYMILQVHDEIVFECRNESIEEAIPVIRDTMSNIIKLNVPLECDIKTGANWAECK